MGKPWYKKWWGITLIVLFLWPFFLTYWVWKRNWNKKARVAVIVAFWMFIWVIIASASSPAGKKSLQEGYKTGKEANINPVVSSIPTSTPQTNTPTSSPGTPSQKPAASTSSKPEPTATSVSKEADVPREYKSALGKAAVYANTMHMSKRGVYDQLVSEYGEKFSTTAAQYAIDNVKADWNANALAKAKNYQDNMNMSPASIHDQLTSEYGEKFTQAEADYAIQHLNE